MIEVWGNSVSKEGVVTYKCLAKYDNIFWKLIRGWHKNLEVRT